MDKCGIEIDPNLHQIKIDDVPVKFTLTEYRMMVELMKGWGQLITREVIRAKVFEGAHVTDRTIDVHICSVRKKLGQYGDCLKTVRGVGYRLESPKQ
jgi:two-component system alkaline phosphatase synthesis response regulator PhoP